MSFGKKPPSAPPSSAPEPAPMQPSRDPYGRRKVIPDEVWEGPKGKFLRELGLSPDDESNLVPNEASIAARIAEGRARHEERNALAQRGIEARLAGAKVRPYFLIPDPCWNGATGLFLMTSLDLYPYDDWNVMYLAADERTALVADIAMHPNGNVPAFVEAAAKFMVRAQEQMSKAHEAASITHDFAAYQTTRDDMQMRVKALAMQFSRALIEAWEKNGPAGRGRTAL